MIDLSKLSKSYPYLSLARQLKLPYGDVLLLSDFFSNRDHKFNPHAIGAIHRTPLEDRDLILELSQAIVRGEIGHGE